MSSSIKNIALGISVFSGLLVLLILAGLFLFETGPVQSAIQKKINSAIPGSLSWRELRLSVFPGRLMVRDFQLMGVDGKEVAGLDRLTVDIQWVSLLNREIVFSAISLAAPHITLEAAADGTLNLVSAVTGPGPPKNKGASSGAFPFNIRVDDFSLKDGAVGFHVPAKKMVASVEGLEIFIRDFDLGKQKAGLALRLKKAVVKRPDFVYELAPSETAAVLENGTLAPISVDLVSTGGTLAVKGAVTGLFTAPEMDLRLNSEIILSRLASVLALTAPTDGVLTLDLSVKGAPADPRCELAVQYGGGEILGQKIGKADFRLALEDRQARILPSQIASAFGVVRLNGKMDLRPAFSKGFLDPARHPDRISYQLDLDQAETEIAGIFPGQPLTGGRVSSRIHLTGKGVEPGKMAAALSVNLKAAEVALNGIHLGDVGFEGALDRTGRADVRELTIGHGDKGVRASGWMDLLGEDFKPHPELPMNFEIALRDLNPLDFFPEKGCHGVVNGTAHLTGPLLSPTASVRLGGKGLVFKETVIGDIDTRLAYGDGVLTLERLNLRNKNSGLDLNGTVRLLAPGTLKIMARPRMDLRVAGDGIFLEDFQKALTGRVSVNGIIRGDAEKHTGNLDIRGSGMDLNGQKIERIRLDTVLEDRKIEFREMAIAVARNASMDGTGWVDPEGKRFGVTLSATAFPLSAIRLLARKRLTHGVLDLTLSGQGTFDDPLVQSHVRIRDVMINRETLSPVLLDLDLKGGILRATGDLGGRLAGEYHFEDRTFEASLDLDGVDLSPYFRMVGREEFSGTIQGAVNASGDLNFPENMRAALDLAGLHIFHRGRSLVKTGPAALTFDKGELALPETEIRLLEKGKVKVGGRGGFQGDIDFHINGECPLDVIDPLVEEIGDAVGSIGISAAVKGTLEHPLVSADLKFNQLGMSLSFIEQQFKQVNGQLIVSPEEIELRAVKGFLGEGEFDLQGKAALAGFMAQQFHMTVNTRQLSLDFPDRMDVTVNSRLRLEGTREKSSLAGEIVLLEGRYYRDMDLDLAGAGKRKRTVAPALEKKSVPFLDKIVLDVHVKRREPFWVDNNLALLSVSPDLTLRGTAGNPLVVGRAQVDSGVLFFQKKEFEVKKGIIDFVNPYKIEPAIALEGNVEVRAWTVFLKVSGTPDNLKFHLTSQPGEEHGDIVSLLLFNKVSRELRQADGGAGFSSADILAGFLSETLQSSMKDSVGLDYVKIDLGRNGATGGQEGGVTVGKDLSRQMSVKYGAKFRGAETVHRVTTEYKLLENFMMSGFQDSGGTFGGGIKYRLEFR